jgi:hypothetical protein
MSTPSSDLELVYLLTDRQGQAYMDTSVDKLRLPAKSDVCDFRDAVKAKNPNKLGAVDSSDLIVYKNMASFNLRQKSLEPLSLLNGSFGSDERNALIVAVPTPSGMVPFFFEWNTESHRVIRLSHGARVASL